MAIRLPKQTLEELDRLFDTLTRPDPDARKLALSRLNDYERGGKLPIDALIELSEASHPAVAMYAIGALGRGKRPEGVEKLLALAAAHRNGNVLFLETIIDALGESESKAATEPLLELLGIKLGWKNKFLGRLSFKKEEVSDEELGRRTELALPVVRALERIADPKAAEALWQCVDSDDPIVRWHAIQAVMKCELTEFNSKLQHLAENDTSDLVREMASIALTKLGPLPPPVNN